MATRATVSMGMVGLLLLGVLLSGPVLPASGQTDPQLQEGDVSAANSESFGPGVRAGWQYVKIVSADGKSFVAVIWGHGGPLQRGAIWVVGSWTRTIGAATVYSDNGTWVTKTVPVSVRSYYLQRFDAIIEFNDTDGNGIGDYVRTSSEVDGSTVIAHEPVAKAASLRASWTKSAGSQTTVIENGTAVKIWSMTLTAENLPYVRLNSNATTNSSWKLDKVAFTFHLKATRSTSTVSVPMWNITVNKTGPAPVVTVTKLPDRTFTANTTRFSGKEDHEFTGWDFEPRFTAPGLILETHMAFGYAVRIGSPEWLTASLVDRQAHGAGTFSWRPQGASQDTRADGSDATLAADDASANASDHARKLDPSRRRVDLNDNWAHAGMLTWVSDTQVWANETATPTTGQVFFQVQAARRFGWFTGGGGSLVHWQGVFLIGGFSYAGGPYWKARHDPETTLDMADVAVPEEAAPAPNRAPVARVTGQKLGYTAKQTVALSGASSSDPDGDPLTYAWTEGSTSLGTGPTLSQSFGVGTHTVSLTVNDGKGATSTTDVTFKVRRGSPGFELGSLLAALVVAVALLRTRQSP